MWKRNIEKDCKKAINLKIHYFLKLHIKSCEKIYESEKFSRFWVVMEKEITHAFAIKTSVHDYFAAMDILT